MVVSSPPEANSMKQKVTFYDCDDISFAKAKTIIIIIIIMSIAYIPGTKPSFRW